nr:hypothetical protein CFP56_60773 [Quercus suber]
MDNPPSTSAGWSPTVSFGTTGHAKLYWNGAVSMIVAYHGGCSFSGLSMLHETGKTTFSNSVGTSSMTMEEGGLVTYTGKSFKSWLVCQSNGKYHLEFVNTDSTRGLDSKHCAKVNLRITPA